MSIEKNAVSMCSSICIKKCVHRTSDDQFSERQTHTVGTLKGESGVGVIHLCTLWQASPRAKGRIDAGVYRFDTLENHLTLHICDAFCA